MGWWGLDLYVKIYRKLHKVYIVIEKKTPKSLYIRFDRVNFGSAV